MYRKTIWMLLWIFLCSPCVLCLGSGSAGQLFSFGDSGIDNGNVFAVTCGLEPAEPYWEGRFSNGPNYLDVLAEAVPGWEATPWAYGGTNTAFGGAQSGLGYAPDIEVPNVSEQVLEFQAEYGETYSSSDMILFSMGQNDLLFNGDSLQDPALVAENMLEAFVLAYENGAKRFIFPTLFPLQLMPGRANDDALDLDQVADWVAQVNAEADALIAGFKAGHPDVSIIRTDLTRLIGKVYANPEKYGITNVTDSAYTGDYYGAGGSVAGDSNTCLWWDEVHVTAMVQELVAQWVLLDVQNELFPGQSSPQAGLGTLLTLLDQTIHQNQWTAARVFELLERDRAPESRTRSGSWFIAPSGMTGSQDSEGASSGWSWHYAGASLGWETRLDTGGAVGISLGRFRGKLSLNNDAGESDTRVYQAGLYGGLKKNIFFMSLGSRYGYADNRAFRDMTLTGTTAINRFHSHLFSGWTEAGLCLKKAGFTISPLVGLAYVRMLNSCGNETGGGLLGYDTVDYPSTRHLRQKFGVRLGRTTAWENGFKGQWSAGAAWQHEYLDNRSQSDVSHAGEVYHFSSPSKTRDSLGLFASLGLSRGERCSVNLNYNGAWAGDAMAQSLNLSFVLAY